MDTVLYFLVFILGAIIGSFLNVVILRYGTGITLFGRSFCFSCQKQLRWYDLFPVVSFLALKGKCNSCKSKISKQYIAVEVLTGLIFALIFWKLGGPGQFVSDFSSPAYYFLLLNFLFYACAFSLLIVLCVYDIKHKIIPDGIVFAFSALAFLRIIFFPQSFAFAPSVWDVFAGPILAFPLAALWYFSDGRWIGLGDAKLALGIGWLLGLGIGLAALILSFWMGAAVGLLLILASKVGRSLKFHRRANIKSELPFAPFMVLGCVVASFFPHLACYFFVFCGSLYI